MSKLAAVIILGSFGLFNSALAKPTDGILFSCSKTLKDATGSERRVLSIGGIIPAIGNDRLAISYSNPLGRYTVLNEAESAFRLAEGDDLDRRYGHKRKVIQNSSAVVNVDFSARTLMVKIPLTVEVDGIEKNREIYLSSVPGSMFFSRNDEDGKTAHHFSAVFTGTDLAGGINQMPDELVDCSFNINFK